ncbi:MAG TPA: hypothetical protein DDW65_10110 [Firmicutes bacterium]|nr:hypothetical protein [Bacillota bacterium]
MDVGKALQKTIDLYLKNFGMFFLAGLMVAIVSIVTIGILAGPLIGGFIILILKIERGEQAPINEIFTHFDKFIPTLLIGIICIIVPMIIGMIPIIGLIFGIIAGPVISIIYAIAIAQTVDKGVEPIEALKKGYQGFMQEPVINWLYGLIIGVMSSIGAIACGFGIVFTLPLGTIGMAIAYQELSLKTEDASTSGTSTEL